MCYFQLQLNERKDKALDEEELVLPANAGLTFPVIGLHLPAKYAFLSVVKRYVESMYALSSDTQDPYCQFSGFPIEIFKMIFEFIWPNWGYRKIILT